MGWRSMENDWDNGIAYCCECSKEFYPSDSVVEGGPEDAICSDKCYDEYVNGYTLQVGFEPIVVDKEEPDIVY